MLYFAVYPFKAVYAYTPSKLPSSVAMHLKPGLTQEIDCDQEVVVKPILSLSLTASDGRSVSNGSLDDVELATNDRETSSVNGGEGIGTMIVYSRRTEGLNGSALLNHSSGGGVSIGSVGCLTQSGIRRSCSLDGVALASRCHGDDSLMYHRGGVDRTRDDSSDDEWNSQGNNSSSYGSINSRSIRLLFLYLLVSHN